MKYFLYLLLTLLLLSCQQPKGTLDHFCDGVVYDKGKNGLGDRHMILKVKKKFYRVYLYKIEYDKYNIGDTVICKNKR